MVRWESVLVPAGRLSAPLCAVFAPSQAELLGECQKQAASLAAASSLQTGSALGGGRRCGKGLEHSSGHLAAFSYVSALSAPATSFIASFVVVTHVSFHPWGVKPVFSVLPSSTYLADFPALCEAGIPGA